MTLNFKKIFISNFSYLILILLILPLFFINVTDSHDWGGDFAQYISQAKNIVEGKPHYETGYIFNEKVPAFGPRTYPPGFPLILSVPYSFFGNDIISFMYVVTLFLFLFALVCYRLYRNYFNRLISLLIVLVTVYNPYMLSFKSEVMSDIPFSFLFILIFLLYRYRQKTLFNGFVIGLLIAFLIQIRTMGYVFLLSVFVNYLIILFGYKSKNADKPKVLFKYHLAIFLTSVIFILIFDYLLFPVPAAYSYSELWLFENISDNLLKNLYNYLTELKWFFEPDVGLWSFSTIILASIAICFFILGLFKNIVKKFSFMEILFIIFISVTLIYPYNGGVRLLIPVLPFILIYIVEALSESEYNFNFWKINFVSIFLILILITYINGANKIIVNQKFTTEGPQKPDAIEIFEEIKNNTPEESVVAFIRPRVLALYTKRRSVSNGKLQNMQEIEDKFKEVKVEYILLHHFFHDKSLIKFLKLKHTELEVMAKNKTFTLYKYK